MRSTPSLRGSAPTAPPGARGAVRLATLLFGVPLALAVVLAPGDAQAEIVWRADFEGGTVELAPTEAAKAPRKGARAAEPDASWSDAEIPSGVRVVTEPVQPGSYHAARFELGPQSVAPAGPDALAQTALTRALPAATATEGSERFYAFSLYTPAALPGVVHRIARFDMGRKTRFAFVSKGDVVDLQSYDGETRGYYGGQTSRLSPGKWHRAILRVVWSRKPERGVVDVWWDGDKMVNDARFATLHADPKAPARLILGLTAPRPAQPTVLFVDEAEEATRLPDLRKPFQPDAAGKLQIDIPFARPAGVPLLLDAWTPEGPGPFPAVILVHGGGFIRGDRQSYVRPLMQVLADAGFAWFSVSYRLAPRWKWPAQVEDVEAAVRFVAANAGSWRLDKKRLAIFGESAGGFIVSSVGVRQKPGGPLAAILPAYTFHAFDLPKANADGTIPLPKGGVFRELFGIEDTSAATQAKLRAAMPLLNLHPKMPPFLCYHSRDDASVPFAQSVRMCDAMKAAGLRCDVLPADGFGHGLNKWGNAPAEHAKLMAWLRQALDVKAAAPAPPPTK